MDKITINTKQQENNITKEVGRCISEIQNNAKRGISINELYVPIYIASEVRKDIEKKLTESGTKYEFLIVKTGSNQYTGKPQSFSGMNVGDKRYYKIRIW